jgi:hypothetical protein
LAQLSVVTDLQGRGAQDIFIALIACMDGLSGFKDAVNLRIYWRHFRHSASF